MLRSDFDRALHHHVTSAARGLLGVLRPESGVAGAPAAAALEPRLTGSEALLAEPHLQLRLRRRRPVRVRDWTARRRRAVGHLALPCLLNALLRAGSSLQALTLTASRGMCNCTYSSLHTHSLHAQLFTHKETNEQIHTKHLPTRKLQDIQLKLIRMSYLMISALLIIVQPAAQA